MTVKVYIQTHIPGLSRRMLIEMKKRTDGILLNGAHVTVRQVLHEGDFLTLHFEDVEASEVEATPMPLDILYEDEDIIVLNKPAPMPTHPSRGHHTDTLANGLAAYFADTPFVFRVLNRLDGVTSGVVLVAKNKLSSSRLSADLREGRFEKHYLAFAQGYFPEKSGRMDQNIKRAFPSIIKRCVCASDEGETALTTYQVLYAGEKMSILDCFPHTGRTHQIRVHLSSAGHPILGDFLYGTEDARLPGRVGLHLGKLSFPHPGTGERMTLIAPLPKELGVCINDEAQEVLYEYTF